MRRERPSAAGEIESDDRREQLRREAHSKGDGKEQRIEQWAAQGHVDREHAHHEDQRHARDQEAEGLHAALEVRVRGALEQASRDRTVRGSGAGGRYDGRAVTAYDARTEESQAVPVVFL